MFVSTCPGVTVFWSTLSNVIVTEAPGSIWIVSAASPAAVDARSIVSLALVVVLTCRELDSSGVLVPFRKTSPPAVVSRALEVSEQSGRQHVPPVDLEGRGVADVPDGDLPRHGVARLRPRGAGGDDLAHLQVRLADAHGLGRLDRPDREVAGRISRVGERERRAVSQQRAALVREHVLHRRAVDDTDVAGGGGGDGAEVEGQRAAGVG